MKDYKSEKMGQDELKSKRETSDSRGTLPSDSQLLSHGTEANVDVHAATFMDVAVLRCLFVAQWQEEGVYWALQYLYNRLRKINEETTVQQMPRRRSNSLPIPKIEVSIYQSPENKKKDDSKEFIDMPDTHEPSTTMSDLATIADLPYTALSKNQETEGNHVRRASEKTKKRMKIADLRAFVETKLLSKSEKALEKIGQEESKDLIEQVVIGK